MTIEHALILKGYAIGQNAPAKIMEAVDAVIEQLKAAKPEMTQRQTITSTTVLPITLTDTSESQPTDEQPKAKKKRNWSPEARAAAAERLQARRVAGLLEKRPAETTTPGEAKAPSKAGA